MRAFKPSAFAFVAMTFADGHVEVMHFVTEGCDPKQPDVILYRREANEKEIQAEIDRQPKRGAVARWRVVEEMEYRAIGAAGLKGAMVDNGKTLTVDSARIPPAPAGI